MHSNENLLTDATGFFFIYQDIYRVYCTATVFNDYEVKFKIYAIYRIGGTKEIKLFDTFYFEVKDAVLTDFNKPGTLVKEFVRAAISQVLDAKNAVTA